MGENDPFFYHLLHLDTCCKASFSPQVFLLSNSFTKEVPKTVQGQQGKAGSVPSTSQGPTLGVTLWPWCGFFFNKFIYLFIYFWLCWVFASVRGLSLVAASRGHSSSQCAGLSLSRPLLLQSAGSVIVAHGPSCSAACGIFPDQGSNPCPLYWQADSQPPRHQGSPLVWIFIRILPSEWR